MSSPARIVHARFAAPQAQRPALEQQARQAGYRLRWLDSDEADAAALDELRILACADLPALDLRAAAALEHVHVMGAGIDHLALEALPPQVLLTNARGIHGPEMRDHVLAAMLAFERQLPRLIAQQAERSWRPFAGGTLQGKTAAVLGLGHVGAAIAGACRALGMTVLATRASPERPGPFDAQADRVCGPAQTRALLEAADHVVVCLPSTAVTRGLLDATMLAAMKDTAVLVVVGRGGVVDEDALAAALRRGALRGAALDVFAREPLPAEHALWSAPRLLLSPHMAGWSGDYLARALGVLLDNRARIDAGAAPLTPVDRARGY